MRMITVSVVCFFQCFSHRYLGWKIHVHDRCDLPSAAGSEQVASVVLPDGSQDLQAKPSLIVTTRVKPDFPPQSIAEPAKFKNSTKYSTKYTSSFPYEIQKPAYNVKRPEMSDFGHVIPVKEEIFEDYPPAPTALLSTSRPQPDNNSAGSMLSTELPAAVPLVKGPPSPPRNSMGNNNNMNRPLSRRPVIMIRRPVQQQSFMMKPPQHGPMMNRPMMHWSHTRPVIVKKPLMRLPPQRPVMMQVSASMMQQQPQQRPLMSQAPPLPPPGRIPFKAVYVHKMKKPIHHPYVTSAPEKPIKQQKLQTSSMVINPGVLEVGSTSLPIAVNTGFNPGSLVIESGFKPIIQSPVLPSAEDRVSEIEYDEGNEGVINVESLDDQKSHTEMFEPMFIPSPLDSNTKHVKKATTEPVKKIRKPLRHVVIRRPVLSNDDALIKSELDDTSKGTTTVDTDKDKKTEQEITSVVPPNHKPSSEESNKPVALPLKDRLDDEEVEIVEVVTAMTMSESRHKRAAHHDTSHAASAGDQHEMMDHHETTEHQHTMMNLKNGSTAASQAATPLALLSLLYALRTLLP